MAACSRGNRKQRRVNLDYILGRGYPEILWKCLGQAEWAFEQPDVTEYQRVPLPMAEELELDGY